MGIFALTATYELRVSRKSHLRDHPTANPLTNVLIWRFSYSVLFYNSLSSTVSTINLTEKERIGSGGFACFVQ
jgi:hypothetical protein